jgi:hypothetical protein
MRRDDRDADFVFASLDLVNLHPFGKREQRIAFHHHLVSLSTQSDEFFWRAVYHPFSLSSQPHQFIDSPKSLQVAKSKRSDWTSSISMEVTNSLLLAEKEVIHVTQISPDPTDPRRNSSCGSRCLSRGNVVMQVRDTLGAIYTDESFAGLFPTHGQPALAPWRLALVTVFQFMEGLTDR